jgi:hypothetical protein
MRKQWVARKTYRTRYPGPQEKLWTAPNGKLIELMICRCFGAHRDSQIEGLEGSRHDGVRVLGVDSVTDDSNDIVGSDSGGPIGEGPGKGGGTDLIDLAEETGNSEDTREGLATDSGSGMFLEVIIGDTDGRLSISEGELIVGEPRG